MRSHNNSRLPSFVLVGLLIAIVLLAYSYWSVSLKNSGLVKNIEEQFDDLKRERLKKLELSKRLETMDQRLKEFMADLEKEKLQTKNFEKAWNSCRAELSDAQHEYELAKNDASVCQNKMTEENDNVGKLKSERDDLQASIDKCQKELDDEKSGRDGDNQQALNSCDRKVDDYRLMVLQKIKEVAGGSAILSLKRLGVDVSGLTLDKTAQSPSSQSSAVQRIQPEKVQDVSALGEAVVKKDLSADNSQHQRVDGHGLVNNEDANSVNNAKDNADNNNGQSVNDKPMPAASDAGRQNNQFQNNAGGAQQNVDHSDNNINERPSGHRNVPSDNNQPPKATPPVDQQFLITPSSPRGAYRKPIIGNDPYAPNDDARDEVRQQPIALEANALSANQITASSPSVAVSASQKDRLLRNAERYKLLVDKEKHGDAQVVAAGGSNLQLANNVGAGAGVGEEINVGDVHYLHQQRPPAPAQIDEPKPAVASHSDAKQAAAVAVTTSPLGARGNDRSALGQQHEEPPVGQPVVSDTKIDKVQTGSEADKNPVDDRDAEPAVEEDQKDNDAGREDDNDDADNRNKDEDEDEDALGVKAAAQQDKAAGAAEDGGDERDTGNGGDRRANGEDDYDEDIKGRPPSRQ